MVGMKWFEKLAIRAQMSLTLKVHLGQLLLGPTTGVEGSARLAVDGSEITCASEVKRLCCRRHHLDLDLDMCQFLSSIFRL